MDELNLAGFLMHSFVCVYYFGPVKGSDELRETKYKDDSTSIRAGYQTSVIFWHQTNCFDTTQYQRNFGT